MLTRRILACACALALAVPAAAGARAAFDPPPTTHHVVYGDTKYDITPSYADEVGSLTAGQLAAAYGTTQPKVTPVASPGSSDDVNGWRIAAVAEAGLLAAIALGAAAFVARMRPRGTAHA